MDYALPDQSPSESAQHCSTESLSSKSSSSMLASGSFAALPMESVPSVPTVGSTIKAVPIESFAIAALPPFCPLLIQEIVNSLEASLRQRQGLSNTVFLLTLMDILCEGCKECLIFIKTKALPTYPYA